jgi:hypothetical protein
LIYDEATPPIETLAVDAVDYLRLMALDDEATIREGPAPQPQACDAGGAEAMKLAPNAP